MYQLTPATIQLFRLTDKLRVTYSPGKRNVSLIITTGKETSLCDSVWVHSRPDLDSTCAEFCALIHMPWLLHPTFTTSIIDTLRLGDRIGFEFRPDAGTTLSMAGHGLHGDDLALHVQRSPTRRQVFLLERLVSPDNWARMCRGAVRVDNHCAAGGY